MEILTYKKIYQLVGDNTSGTNECITKSAAVQIAESHRKNVTSNLSQYLNNEYIDVFAVEDKPDLSAFSFANNRYNPQATGNTYTTAVSSRNIDGNAIEYNATADVDWITDIVINSTEIRFRVAANMGDQRTGHITGSNATGKSDIITIIQEAKEANLVYTYSLIATCESIPTVTINGTAITRYTTSSNTYTFQYTTRVRTESEAPESVGFTISGGGAGDTYNEGTLSISPTSWDLKEGLSKQFTVGYSRIKTTKAWDHATGTIARNDSTNVSLTTSTTTEYPAIDYTIRDTHPQGQSFSHSKNGMKFTTTASSVDSTGSISVQYNNLTATANVVCTIVYNTYTYTVKASDTNTSGTPTIIINGRNATVTHSGGYYIGKLSITESSTVTAPQNTSWSISGGNKATEWGKYNVSISPNSWNLDDGLTKNFSVSMIKSGTKYDWNKTSGTVARDTEVSVVVASSSTNYTGSSYSITGPSGISFTKNGTNVSATASSTSNTGTITVICTDSGASGESATCNVTYTPALRSWVYTVNASCQEKPTITIGDSDAVITGETNAWVGTVTKLSQEDPGELAYSVTSGSSSKTWGEIHISTNPTSITIDQKPKSITFKAYAYQDYVEHTAKIATGITSNKRASCKPVSSDISKTTGGCTCSVTTNNVSDIPGSMSVSKAGTAVTGTASDSGSVTISYSNEGHDASATVNITYERPPETFPDWTYELTTVFTGLNDNCTLPYWASGELESGQIRSVMYRTGSYGTYQEYNVAYTGSAPSSISENRTNSEKSGDLGVTLVQEQSGKTLQLKYKQYAFEGTKTYNPTVSFIQDGIDENRVGHGRVFVDYASLLGGVPYDVTFSGYVCTHLDNNSGRYKGSFSFTVESQLSGGSQYISLYPTDDTEGADKIRVALTGISPNNVFYHNAIYVINTATIDY